MQDAQHVAVLRRAGIALFALAVLDLCAFAYAIANEFSYASSVSFFAVIAGVCLVRGSLQAAAVVRWIALLLVATLGSVLILLPVLRPVGLWLVEMRQNPGTAVFGLALGLIFIAVLVWVARQLGSPPVLQARAGAALRNRSASVPIAIGMASAVALTILGVMFQRSDAATRAIEIVEAAHGSGYRYQIRSLSYRISPEGKRVSGVVTAWNEREIKHVPFQWKD